MVDFNFPIDYKYQALWNNSDSTTTPISPSQNNLVFGQQEATNTTAALTPEGNVPLVSTQPKVNDAGLTLEKTVAKGPSLDETLTKFYPKDYQNASIEDKEKMAVKYFNWLNKSKKETINQLDQFKLYRNRCSNDEEYQRLSGIIDKMEAKYQLNAAKTVITDGTERQKNIGTKAVAGDIQNYDKTVQLDATKLIVDSNNTEAIKVGASHASELAIENQTPAVGIYQTTKLSEQQQKEVDKILIGQYEQYAKENQIDIHKIMSSSLYTETVELAAANIWKFDKTNQSAAMQVTIDTKNEAAIDAASAQWAKYDDSAKADIKTMIQNTEYESAKTALATAEKEAQAKAEAKVETTKESSDKTETTNTTAAKIEEIKEQMQNPNSSALKESIKNLSASEQISLLRQCPNNSSIIKIMLQNNPSLEVLSEINLMLKDNDDLIDSKILLPQLCFLNASVQDSLIKQSAANKDLGLIDRRFLSASAKLSYDKIAEQQKKAIV